MTDSARTEEIRARVEKATPGHWWWTGDVKGNRALSTRRTSPWRDVISVDDDGYLVVRGGDMAFLSHAKADAEYLLTELTALREEVERLKGALEIAFVQGAQWWEWERTSFTMWGADRNRAEAEAAKLNAAGTLGMTYEERMKRAAALSPSPAQQEPESA